MIKRNDGTTLGDNHTLLVFLDMVDQFLVVTSGWAGVTITKFFSQLTLLQKHEDKP
jgi:hypothetical protein